MPNLVQLLIALALGAGAGLVIGWLLGTRQPTAPAAPAPNANADLETELRQQLAQRDTDLARTRDQLTQSQTALATAQANQSAAEKMLASQKELYAQAQTDAKAAQEKALADLREPTTTSS